MELVDGSLQITSFLAITLGIVVLFVGKRINGVVGFLREFSIPEPVTGGLLFSVLFGLVYAVSGVAVEFDLAARDVLLVYFFTTIGINASLKDLLAGGKPLVVLLIITIAYMVLQNLTGITVASLFDLPSQVGMLGGSVSLIGGHGTAIAWAPRIADEFGISNAMEVGIACATFGLILASLMGGPIAKFLITRHKLEPAMAETADVGLSQQQEDQGIGHLDFLDAILAIHVCVIAGVVLNEGLEEAGLQAAPVRHLSVRRYPDHQPDAGQSSAYHGYPLAKPQAGDSPDRGYLARYLFGDVADEHATLDVDRPGRSDFHYSRHPVRGGHRGQPVRGVPGHGA